MGLEARRLTPLFAPRSIAVIGASGRRGRPGCEIIRGLRAGGFEGELYPITPRYDTIEDIPCVATLEDLPGPVDLAVVAGSAERMEAELARVIECGARSALVFANAYLPEDGDPPLVARVGAMAREAKLPLLGPNTIGFVNHSAGCAGSWIPPHVYEAGPIALVVQSGSVFTYSNNLDPRIRFSITIQTGQEASVGVGDCMSYALEVPGTRVLGLFLETVGDAEAFIAALEKAQRMDIPVVAIKLGRSRRAARFVATHSGRLAGDDAAFEAVFKRHGVSRAGTMNEWWATLMLMSHSRRPGPGGLAAMTDSGGLRAHLVDLAEDVGVRWAAIDADTVRRLRSRLEPSLEPLNPVDAWGGQTDWEAVFADCFLAVADDPDASIGVVFSEYGSSNSDGFPTALGAACKQAAAVLEKPIIAASHTSRQCYPDVILDLVKAGIPVLDGAECALRAIRHAFAYRDSRTAPLASPPQTPGVAIVERWRSRLARDPAPDEHTALELLRDFGVPTVSSIVAEDEAAVLAACRALGLPVAVKTAMPDVSHKSDVDGVRLGLRGEDEAREAYTDLRARLGPRVIVSAMAPRGVEIALGMVTDPQFGPLIMVGGGGMLVEAMKDVRFGLPPLSEGHAAEMVRELRVAPLLTGLRGQPPSDAESLHRTVAALSVLALSLRDVIAEIDINPVIVSPDGCLAVDALVKTRI